MHKNTEQIVNKEKNYTTVLAAGHVYEQHRNAKNIKKFKIL